MLAIPEQLTALLTANVEAAQRFSALAAKTAYDLLRLQTASYQSILSGSGDRSDALEAWRSLLDESTRGMVDLTRQYFNAITSVQTRAMGNVSDVVDRGPPGLPPGPANEPPQYSKREESAAPDKPARR